MIKTKIHLAIKFIYSIQKIMLKTKMIVSFDLRLTCHIENDPWLAWDIQIKADGL